MHENIRPMHFAGLFYERNVQKLKENLADFFQLAEKKKAGEKKQDEQQTAVQASRIFLLPHAGHIYSGQVTADTLAQIHIPKKLIILCPNHTGRGKHGAVWSKGAFATPLGNVPIAEDIAEKLLAAKIFSADEKAHMEEHSIEVLLPFLQYQYGQNTDSADKGMERQDSNALQVVPICLGSMDNLENMAIAIAKIMQEDEETGLLISSDMNHFATEKENRRKDFLALEALRQMQEKEFVQCIIRHDISMCGVLGAYIGILVAKKLGLQQCILTSYDTSASRSGDSSRVVGYAGLYFK